MKHTWTKTMVFVLMAILLLSVAACKDKQEGELPEGGSEQTTDMLGGNVEQSSGDQFDRPNDQGNQNEQSNQDNNQGNNQGNYEQQTQPVVNVPDNSNTGNTDNNSNTGNTGNSGSSTDSTGLTFASNGNGTCTLTGLGACSDICVVIPSTSPAGDKVTAIAAQAFYNCTSITVVQIPASVTNIGHLAFGGCTGLVYVTVSTQNASYKDIGGVLYTSDGKTLVHYPAASGASSVNIPAGVTQIEDMAFYGCKSLKSIRYGGTQEAWSRIAVGSMNYSLNAASVTCSDSGK